MRLLPKSLAVAALAIALAAPSPALAAQSYAITLAPSVGTTFERTILNVTMTHQLAAIAVYAETPCGFAAQMSTSKARSVAHDARVASVTPDGSYSP